MPIEQRNGVTILRSGPQTKYFTAGNCDSPRGYNYNTDFRFGSFGRYDELLEFVNDNSEENQYFIERNNILRHHTMLVGRYALPSGIYFQPNRSAQGPGDPDLNEIDLQLWRERFDAIEEVFGEDQRITFPVTEGMVQSGSMTVLKGTRGTPEQTSRWRFFQQFLLPGISDLYLVEEEPNTFILRIDDPLELGNNDNIGQEENAYFRREDIPRNWLWYGAPGTGKSYGLQENAESLITNNAGEIDADFFPYSFSPATSYGDFVGEYRPNMVYNTDELPPLVNILGEVPEPDIPGAPVIDYSFIPGVFTRALVRAFLNQEQGVPVVLLIDEINRGDIYEILGEVFQLMERNDYGEGSYSIALSPAAMDYINAETGQQMETIRLPENLYIWGTMNPNDSSVQQIDSAFFRRWIVRYISIDYVTENADERDIILIQSPLNVRWGELRSEINRLLGDMGYDEEEFIGRYFVKRDEFNDWNRFYSKLIFHLANNVMKGNLQENDIFSEASVREIMRTCEEGRNPFRIDNFQNARFGIEEVAEEAADEVAEEVQPAEEAEPEQEPEPEPGPEQAEDGPRIEGEEE